MTLKRVLICLVFLAFGPLMDRDLGQQAVNDNSAWEMLQQSVVDHLSVRDPSFLSKYLVQIPETDVYARWDDPDGGVWSLLQVADTVPEWNLTWKATGQRFSEEYGRFLAALSVESSDPNVSSINGLLERYKSSKLRVKTPTDGYEERYPFNASSSSLRRLKQDGESQIAQGKVPISWSFNAGAPSNHRESRSATTKTYAAFFTLSDSSEHTKRTLDIGKNGVMLSFAAYQMTAIPVTPGEWYSGSVVAKYKAGPFKADSGVTQEGLWGPNGRLSVLVVSVVVVYKPQVSVKLSKQDYELVHEHYLKGGSVSIGPFTFGNGSRRSYEKVSWKNEEKSFTISSDSPDPQILAIVSVPLNYALGNPRIPTSNLPH